MTDAGNIVVVGCSGCGALAARTLQKLKPSLNVTILREADEKGLLTRCATPYICCGHVMVDPSYKNDSIFTEQNIKLINVKATEINRTRKVVITEDGNVYGYDKLILAMGAQPIVLPVPGINLPGVFTLRKSGDAVNIQHWINTKRVKTAALIGAGPVGVEVAYLAARHGIKVHLVEMFDHILSKALDADMSGQVETYMQQHDIDLRLGQRIERINGNGQVESIALSSGENIPAQMVLLFTGVRPNSQLAEQAGLEMGKLGLHVNSYLQTSDPDIYAAGDLIEYASWITGKPMLGQLRPNAVIGGRVIAKNILGKKIKYPGFINSFATKFFDKSIAGAGITELQAREENMDVIATVQSAASQHSMMRERQPYTVKLIFDKQTHKLIGGQIVSDSECPVKHIDALTVAIRGSLTAWDLATLRCAGQPELSPDPGMEPIALAAEKACGMLE